MALVPEANERSWYEVMQVPDEPDAWVAAHVLPVLIKPMVGAQSFRNQLVSFMQQHAGCEVVADHPADFMHLCDQLNVYSADRDFALPVEFSMRLVNTPVLRPAEPHNALADAH